MGKYTIKSGDTLGSIAKTHGVSVQQLKDWNGIKGDTIYAGNTLKINRASNNSREQRRSEYIRPGAYYLSYPGHMIQTEGQGIDLGKQPLGHAGVVIVGDDGSVTQYDYGRYDTSNVIGTRNEQNRGNWTKTNRGRVTIGGDYSTLLDAVYDNAGKDASENVRLTYAHDANPQKVIDYINNDANSVDRAIYGIGPFAAEKWEAVKNGELGFGEAVREMCTAKGCATSAYDAVSAGVPFMRRTAGSVRNMFNGAISAAKELFSRDRDGIGANVYFSPRNRERSLQRMGYQTYDSNDYIDYD